MRVTELLMRPGGWSMDLLPTAPPSIVQAVRDALATYDSTNERWLPVLDGQIVVFDTDLRDPSLGRARYTGRLCSQNGTRSFGGPGIAAYMETDDGIGHLTQSVYEVNRNSLWEVVENLELSQRINGLSVGTDYTPGGSLVSIPIPPPVGAREILDTYAKAFGQEWRCNPDGTIDAGEPGDGLFVTNPVVLVDAQPTGGQFGSIRRVNGSAATVSIHAEQAVSEVHAYDKSAELQKVTSVADVGRGLTGDELDHWRAIDLPGESSADAVIAATAALNAFYYPRASFDLTTSDPYVRRFVQPGDTVYVHFPEAGIKSENVVNIGGEVIRPQKVRVHEIDWGVHEGHGVFLRRHDGVSETWLRLTPYVQFSDSNSTWKVGTTKGMLDRTVLQGGARLGTVEVIETIYGPASAGAPAVRGPAATSAPYAPAVRGTAAASTAAPFSPARRGG